MTGFEHKRTWFGRFSKRAAYVTGLPITFFVALAIIAIWAVTGPIFQFNDTWQLVINTGTTIITFLMVFLIQNAQNRDSAAIQLKLDELIRVIEDAHKSLMDLEELEEEELEQIKSKYQAIASKARKNLRSKEEVIE